MRPTDLDWPCNNVVPGMAPMAAILARTEETVVAVTGIRAYPTGFGFTLNLRLRNLHRRERRGFWPFPEFGYHGGRTVPADAFRFTIEFADGRSVTNLNPGPQRSRGAGLRAADVEQRAGNRPGGQRLIARSLGLGHGLPGSAPAPPRPLAFVCVWPERGIPPSRVEVDGAAVLGAADAAVTLWADDPYCSAD